jgi:hypothetical protein
MLGAIDQSSAATILRGNGARTSPEHAPASRMTLSAVVKRFA